MEGPPHLNEVRHGYSPHPTVRHPTLQCSHTTSASNDSWTSGRRPVCAVNPLWRTSHSGYTEGVRRGTSETCLCGQPIVEDTAHGDGLHCGGPSGQVGDLSVWLTHCGGHRPWRWAPLWAPRHLQMARRETCRCASHHVSIFSFHSTPFRSANRLYSLSKSTRLWCSR